MLPKARLSSAMDMVSMRDRELTTMGTNMGTRPLSLSMKFFSGRPLARWAEPMIPASRAVMGISCKDIVSMKQNRKGTPSF